MPLFQIPPFVFFSNGQSKLPRCLACSKELIYSLISQFYTRMSVLLVEKLLRSFPRTAPDGSDLSPLRERLCLILTQFECSLLSNASVVLTRDSLAPVGGLSWLFEVNFKPSVASKRVNLYDLTIFVTDDAWVVVGTSANHKYRGVSLADAVDMIHRIIGALPPDPVPTLRCAWCSRERKPEDMGLIRFSALAAPKFLCSQCFQMHNQIMEKK